MSTPINELLFAINSKVMAEPVLLQLLGGAGLKDRRLARAAGAELMVGEVKVADLSTDEDETLEVILTLSAFAATGRRDVEAIAARLRLALDNAALSLATYQLVSLQHQKTTSKREEKTQAFRADLTLRAVVTGFGAG